jgi:hypothetical protein
MMKIIKDAVTEAIREYLTSKEGQLAIGKAVYDAVNAAMSAEVRFEDGKSEPGKVVEKTETVNIAHWLARYLPSVEASIRGCQADAAAARNRAVESLTAVERVANALVAISQTPRIGHVPQTMIGEIHGDNERGSDL